MHPVVRLTLTALLGFGSLSTARADWTHYRGPNHDGTYLGNLRTDWSTEPPRRLWERSIEPALSSITIAGGRAFTQARRPVGGEDREFVVAIDAATGSERWAVNVDLADYPHGGVGDDDGPRSTPVIDGRHVYVFTTYLRLFCLEAETGTVVWMRDFRSELGATVVEWQNAASPVILGDLVFVNANAGSSRLMAIRKTDGTTAWRRHDRTMTQATPVAATIAGTPHVIFFTKPGLVAVRPDDGDLLWEFPFPFSTSTAASPVVAGDIVYCSAAYTSGSGAVRVTPTASGAGATQLWKKRNEHMNHWATPVHHQGHLYGVYGQSFLSLRCLDLETGTERWRQSQVGSGSIGYGSVLKVADRLLVLTDSGEIVLVDPSPEGYRELRKFSAVTGKCWNNAAIDDGILYVRSTTRMAAWDLSLPAPASPLRINPRIEVSQGRARVRVGTVDGSAVDSARAAAVALQATDDPSRPSADWQAVDAPRRVIGGQLEWEDPVNPAIPRRYYRTRENP